MISDCSSSLRDIGLLRILMLPFSVSAILHFEQMLGKLAADVNWHLASGNIKRALKQ